MGQSWPLFVYLHSFLIPITISIIQIEKSVDGVLGIRTQGRRKVGKDETMELWRPPPVYFVRVQLLCLCWFFISCTCLVESKLVKQKVGRTVILSLIVSVLVQWYLYLFVGVLCTKYNRQRGTVSAKTVLQHWSATVCGER